MIVENGRGAHEESFTPLHCSAGGAHLPAPRASLAPPPSSGRPRRAVPTAPLLLRWALTLLLTHLLRRLLHWALPAAGPEGRRMKRGFFGGGTSSPRGSASAPPPEAAAADDDDVEGLELPKNRRRLPKKLVHPYEPVAELCRSQGLPAPPAGLSNVGNSCFAAASLQCLMATPPFAALLLAGYHARCGKPFCALCYLQEHAAAADACAAAAADASADTPPSPPQLAPLIARIRRLGPQFVPGRQEDAHDFVHALLDDVGGEAAFDAATAATSAVYHVFGGSVRSAVRCRRCSGVSATHESFLTLPLEVAGRGIGSLEDAFAASLAGGEELKGGNAYRCDACADLTPARKAARLAAAPNALALALKRYSGGFFGKLNKRVTYGATLDLSRFMARQPARPADGEAAPAEAADAAQPPPPATYWLCGVVVHHDWALSTSAGHYVAYVRRGGVWWKCDDAVITQCSEAVALAQTAYMLFYCADEPRPAPAVRPAWQEDTAEEIAEAAARLQAAARRRAAAEAAEEVVPDHKLIREGTQPAPEVMNDGNPEPEETWPEKLVLTVALPLCGRVRDFGVTIEGQSLQLLSVGRYKLESRLPYPVNEDYQGTFDTDKRALKLTMEVLRLPREPPPGTKAQRDSAASAAAPPPPPPPPPPQKAPPQALAERAKIRAAAAEQAALGRSVAALRVAD